MLSSLLAAVAAVTLTGAPRPAADPAPAAEALAAARLALDATGPFVYENQPLAAVVADLKERAKLAVILDPALPQSGIDPNGTMVTVNLKSGKLRDGLRAALGPIGLQFGLIREGLFISTEEGVISRQMRQRVSIDHAGTPFAAAAKQLAAETGANVVVDPRLKDLANAPATLKLDDVTLETAVRLLAEVADLKAVRMGNVLFVTTVARAKDLRPDADGPTPAHSPNPVFGGIGGNPIPVEPPVIKE